MSKNFCIRFLMSLIGLVILGIGVSFTIQCNLGADPASTFEIGMTKQLGIGYGTVAMLYNIVLLTIIFFVDKKYIHVSSVLAIFVVGYVVEFVSYISLPLGIINLPLYMRILICIFGCMIISIGVTVYIFADLGVAATDCISEIISSKTGFSYRAVRVASDFILVVLGYSIGGIVGIGTLLITFLVGPFIQFSRKILYPLLIKILEKTIIDKVNSDEKNFEKEIIS